MRLIQHACQMFAEWLCFANLVMEASYDVVTQITGVHRFHLINVQFLRQHTVFVSLDLFIDECSNLASLSLGSCGLPESAAPMATEIQIESIKEGEHSWRLVH